MAKENVYSTFEAARLLNVFTSTVIHWMNSGKLKGYRTPGGHRRIPKEELARFIKENKLEKYVNMEPKKKKILIVEDDKDAMDLYMTILGNEKYEIKKAYTGFNAGIVNDFMPDLIILDILLPDIDGEQICKFIKLDKRAAKAKILAVSALSDKKTMNRMFNLGVDDYLTKPYLVSELCSKIDKLLAA